MLRLTLSILLIALTLVVESAQVDAQRRGGGGARGGGAFRGGGFARASARPSVTRPMAGNFSRAPTLPANGEKGIVNRPGGDRANVGVDRPINIRDHDVIIGGGRVDPGYGCCYRYSVAAAAGVALGAAAATAAIGSAVYSLPVGCSVVVVNGVTYDQCGDVWYQPQFVGTDATYIVVAPPR